MNIFMFLDLSMAAGTETTLVEQQWDTALESNMLTSYAETSVLMKNQRILTIVGWEGASKIIDKWLVLIDIILGSPELHPAVHDISVLVEAAE